MVDAAPHPSRPVTGRPAARLLVVVVAAAVAALLAASCSSGPDTASAAIDPSGAVVLDVRTPAEYAEGHLEGAVSLDVQAGDFQARLAELDPSARYLVYCRSGSRSAVAVSAMEAAGFAGVTDLGSLEAAADATGLDVVG